MAFYLSLPTVPFKLKFISYARFADFLKTGNTRILPSGFLLHIILIGIGLIVELIMNKASGRKQKTG